MRWEAALGRWRETSGRDEAEGMRPGKDGKKLLETNPTQTQVETYRSTEESSAPGKSEASRDRGEKR